MNDRRPFPPDHRHHTYSAESQQEEWERKLQQLRAQNGVAPPSPYATQKQAPRTDTIRPQPAIQNMAQAEAREEALLEYLRQWQHEINADFAEDQPEEDASVLLQEDWISAQTALQGEVDDSIVEKTSTVWVNPKRGALAEPVLEQAEIFEESATDEDKIVPSTVRPENIPVTINIINPNVAPNLPVMCLSEKELLDRLTRKLLPHLTDAVSGMIRTVVQKQTAAMTYQIQQSLAQEAPNIVKEILDHNLRTVMKDIRYDLKYKRR